MYDSTLGRFIQRDLPGASSQPNAYVYTQDNPITETDPRGRSPALAAALALHRAQVAVLIRQLDHDAFIVRQRAQRDLLNLCILDTTGIVESALTGAMAPGNSLEVRQAAECILTECRNTRFRRATGTTPGELDGLILNLDGDVAAQRDAFDALQDRLTADKSGLVRKYLEEILKRVGGDQQRLLDDLLKGRTPDMWD